MARWCALIVILCAAVAAACGDDGTEAPRDPFVLTQGSADTRAIAFVFELGNTTYPGKVAEILPALRDAQVRATFALTGRWAEANAEQVLGSAA
jgi:hypothetical protein